MGKDGAAKAIDPKMTVLDVIGAFRKTESVFKAYDERAGVCLCCQALFEPLEEVAREYGLDLTELLADLNAAIDGPAASCVESRNDEE